MPTQSTSLNDDTNARVTSAYYADRGDGVSGWHHYNRVADGADVAQGDKDDAAVTNPASSASVVALLKGLLTKLTAGATTLLKLEDDGHASGDAGVMALAVRRDTMAVSSGTTGDYEPLQTDSSGRLRTVDNRVGALSNARTTALDNILLVKGSAGTLFGFQGYTDDDGYIVVIADADGTISNGAQCLEAIPVIDPAGGGIGGPFSVDFGRYGLAVSTGICIAFSTTGPTFTDGGNHVFVSAQYE
jgi:hypothetical protein